MRRSRAAAATKASTSSRTGAVNTKLEPAAAAAVVRESRARITGEASTGAARRERSTDIVREAMGRRGGGRRRAGPALAFSAGETRPCQGQLLIKLQYLRIPRMISLPAGPVSLVTVWLILSEIWQRSASTLMEG